MSMQKQSKTLRIDKIRAVSLKKVSTEKTLGPWLVEYSDGDREIVGFVDLPYIDEIIFMSPIQSEISEDNERCGKCGAVMARYFSYYWPVLIMACRILEFNRRDYKEVIGGFACPTCRTFDSRKYHIMLNIYEYLKNEQPSLAHLPTLES